MEILDFLFYTKLNSSQKIIVIVLIIQPRPVLLSVENIRAFLQHLARLIRLEKEITLT